MRVKGCCRVLYCLDVARRIDLSEAERALAQAKRATFQHKSRVPTGGGVSPSIRLTWGAPAIPLGRWNALATPELAIYDQGALCVTWSIPFDDPLDVLVGLAVRLYENEELLALSRRVAGEVLEALGPAAVRAAVHPIVEDYVCFEVEGPAGDLLTPSGAAGNSLAGVLRAEEGELSRQEVEDALGARVSYRPEEVCFVDWLGALLVGTDTEDERLVLELANIELLELRLLDAQLDVEIEESYAALARRTGLLRGLVGRHRELQRIGRMQADDALLHEGIDNALKLFGDDYLARVYRTVAARFHFNDWDASIERKLGMLRNVHQSLSDLAAHRRSEVLEWIIIVLIAADIALYFTPLR